STEDIKALIQFYESPLGQRVVRSMPQVTQESESAGIQLDQKAAINVLRGMQTEYPELKQMLPPENGAPGAGPEPSPAPGPPLAPAPVRKPSPAPPPQKATGTDSIAELGRVGTRAAPWRALQIAGSV